MTLESAAFRTIDRLASRLGLFGHPLAKAELIERAQRRSGLTEFGDWSFEAALGALLQSYNDEADLSVFGRFAARWDMIRRWQQLQAERGRAIFETLVTEALGEYANIYS